MDQTTVMLVQQSWDRVNAITPHTAAIFYANLFESDPSLRKMFSGDMVKQGEKLLQMVGAAVTKLSDLPSLIPVLESLAKRHNGYGVKQSHYLTVGAALFMTLEQGLGKEFTANTKAAWVSAYMVMACTMMASTNTRPFSA